MSNVSRTGKEEINNATSQTTFGKSVESQAQIQDAQASPDAGGEMLNIYRLEPIAGTRRSEMGQLPRTWYRRRRCQNGRRRQDRRCGS